MLWERTIWRQQPEVDSLKGRRMNVRAVRWLRWLLVVPAAVTAALVVRWLIWYSLRRYLDPLQAGIFTQVDWFLGSILSAVAMGFTFTAAGMYVAPSRRFEAGITLAVLLGAYGIFSVGVAFAAPVTPNPWMLALQTVLMIAGAAGGVFTTRRGEYRG